MKIFWDTIASYNSSTWYLQILIVAVAIFLTVMLYRRPSHRVKVAMKLVMAALNVWIAGVYYLIYCDGRDYNEMYALFWAIMGGIWIYDLLIKHASLACTGKHNKFALVLFAMPFVYPAASLLLGRSFPMMTSPVMPCSVAVFTIGLMLAFSERVNIVLSMFLCHWALISFSKVYFFGIPEDYILACSVVPALYIFFREYIQSSMLRDSKPSAKVLNALLVILCVIIGVFFTYSLFRQVDMFAK